jgi:hypothetical protein
MYVQKLQEEWFDPSEKTKVIVEFEGYISGIDSANSTTIYTLLESLLLEGEDDKSEKNLMFVALKNLTPTNIECALSTDVKGWKCYNAIIERLDIIKVNNDIDENKALAKEILEAIAVYPDMTNADKNNFKAILSSFVYWGVDNIPEGEKKEEIAKPNVDQGDESDSSEDSAIFWVLKTILFIFLIIVGIFFWIFILFFIFYKISNKDDNVGFQDFIIEKTSGHKKKIVVQKDETEDILKELWDDLWEKKSELNNSQTKPEVKKEEVKDPLETIEKPAEVSQVKTNKEEVPDWLKWNFSDEKEVKKETTQNNSHEQKKENKQKEVKKNDFNSSKKTFETKEVKKDDGDVPDWLKWSFTEETKTTSKTETKQKTDIKSEVKNEVIWEEKVIDNKNISKPYSNNDQKSEKISENKEIKKDDWDVPDWLKWAIDSEPKKESKSEKKVENKSQDIPKRVSEKQDTPKMETQEDLDKITDIKEIKNTEIPDWLKWSLDEKTTSIPKKDEKKSEIPDWLKWSLDESTKTDKAVSVKSDKKDETKKVSDKVVKEKEVEISENLEEVKDEAINVEPLKTEKKIIKEEKIIKTTQKKTIPKTKVKTEKVEAVTKTLEKQSNVEEKKIVKEEKIIDKKPKAKNIEKPKSKEVTGDEKKEKLAEKKLAEKKKTEDELWDDGMKIPDWLKTDDDK